MYECFDKAHKKGHRTAEARNACIAKQKRRNERKKAKARDEARRRRNLERESVDAYVKRRFCIEGTQAVNVAASLNRDYPRREGRSYSWVDVIEVHSLHVRWPIGTQFEDYLSAHPEVLLPSEVRKLAGDSVESAREL
jgi:hypothetical protein